jgi:ribosomal protein L11 methyltransferase
MAHWVALVVDRLARRRFSGVSSAMFNLGAAGVAEEGDGGIEPAPRQTWDIGPPEPPARTVRLRAWFEAPNEAVIAAAEACLPHGVEARWEAVPDEDWSTAWKVNFPVIRVGRLTVAPPWEAEPGALLLEPGQGFGTGQHATTRQVLERLVSLLDAAPPARVLDVGCGSGILALAAAHLGADAYGIDHDPVAVADAHSQAARNGLNVSFDTTPLADVPGRWTIVLANLFADTIVDLAEELVARTGDHLILGGILSDREQRVREIFDPRLGEPERSQDGDWVCLHYRGPDAERSPAE